MKDPYQVLGVSPKATDDEIKDVYHDLAKRYHPDNYDDANPLKELAAEKMKEINLAYEQIQKMRADAERKKSNSSYSDYDNTQYTGSTTGIYAEARRFIDARKFTDAEKLLSTVEPFERTAEWHYLASVLLMHRNRVNDAMRELEKACSMDPGNMEYQKMKEMFNTSSRGYGSSYYNTSSSRPVRSSSDDACNCCANLLLLDCLCECCGGDFISCI